MNDDLVEKPKMSETKVRGDEESMETSIRCEIGTNFI